MTKDRFFNQTLITTIPHDKLYGCVSTKTQNKAMNRQALPIPYIINLQVENRPVGNGQKGSKILPWTPWYAIS